MNAEELHKQQLEENSLAKGLSNLAKKAKSGHLVSPKVLAVILAVILGGGLWWYLSTQGKKDDSHRWSEYELARGEDAYKKVADENPKSNVAQVARLAAARLKLTADGLAKLSSPKDRAGAIDAVAKSRDEFKQLAADFEKSGDRLLRVEAIRLGAQAELALVGVPKTGTDGLNVANQLGSVATAIEMLNSAAKIIGESTPAGERFKKQASELAAANNRKDTDEASTPAKLGRDINGWLLYVPETKIEPKAPDKPLAPIPDPKPPEGAPTTPSTAPSTRSTNR